MARDGYSVRIAENPTLSLDGDVAAVRQIFTGQDGSVVLYLWCRQADVEQSATHVVVGFPIRAVNWLTSK